MQAGDGFRPLLNAIAIVGRSGRSRSAGRDKLGHGGSKRARVVIADIRLIPVVITRVDDAVFAVVRRERQVERIVVRPMG